MDFLAQIKENNKTHTVNEDELKSLISQAKDIYAKEFDQTTFFERSVFINWTCGIADCKYCYLSTQPKLAPNATRHQASILAEILICKILGWKVGYITGGLRVESTEELIGLLNNIEKVYGKKIMMNFGPYTNSEVEQLAPHITGMGSAIESFDEELHKFICPSKPLPFLMKFLEHLQTNKLKKLITIILGVGERKEDLEKVSENIKKYGIETVQLCFLKPQENTVFDDVPAPDPQYMAWWIANLRVLHPQLNIKVALVRERISDVQLYLDAGANGFSRFMVFKDFASPYAKELLEQCELAGRRLEGEFITCPELDIDSQVDELKLDEKLKEQIRTRAHQYYKKLQRLEQKFLSTDL